MSCGKEIAQAAAKKEQLWNQNWKAREALLTTQVYRHESLLAIMPRTLYTSKAEPIAGSLRLQQVENRASSSKLDQLQWVSAEQHVSGVAAGLLCDGQPSEATIPI